MHKINSEFKSRVKLKLQTASEYIDPGVVTVMVLSTPLIHRVLHKH